MAVIVTQVPLSNSFYKLYWQVRLVCAAAAVWVINGSRQHTSSIFIKLFLAYKNWQNSEIAVCVAAVRILKQP
jgi:hypothetical protein